MQPNEIEFSLSKHPAIRESGVFQTESVEVVAVLIPELEEIKDMDEGGPRMAMKKAVEKFCADMKK